MGYEADERDTGLPVFAAATGEQLDGTASEGLAKASTAGECWAYRADTRDGLVWHVVLDTDLAHYRGRGLDVQRVRVGMKGEG